MATDTQSPFDARLLRRAQSVRRYFVQGALISVLQTGIIIGFSWSIAQLITGVLDGAPLSELQPVIALFLGSILCRSLLSWCAELVALRGASALKSQFRRDLLGAAERIGPEALTADSAAKTVTLIGQGLDSLDAYFSKFLPQLIATAITTPILIVVLLWQDLFTGIAVIVSIPLIPVFMALIGWATEKVQLKQWRALSELSRAFLELINGLATLKIFRRQYRQSQRLHSITEEYRSRTMKVLRISFVSSFVLELAASLSLAIVAVSIGLRLLDGTIALSIGLFVLLLTPEAFLPIRQVGAQYHASAEGVAAVNDVFEMLDRATEYPEHSDDSLRTEPYQGLQRGSDLILDDVSITRGDVPVIQQLSAQLSAGKLSVILGPSGSGKSSLFAAILGMIPYQGNIRLGDYRFTQHSLAQQRAIAWSPQQAKLFTGTVAENITLAPYLNDEVDLELFQSALQAAAIAPEAAQRQVGIAGGELSGGQAQRVSLARTSYIARAQGRPLLLFDEPTSALDSDTEQQVLTGLRALAADGFTVVVISHRQAVAELADQVVQLAPVNRAAPQELRAHD